MKRTGIFESTAAVICAIFSGFRKRAVQRRAGIVTQAMIGVILIVIAAPRASADPATVWLRIMAFSDAPVVGAEVRVSDHRSQGKPLVDVQAATNSQGVFPVAVRSHSSSFRITISGGTTNGNPFPWHLMADVELTDPAHQIVVVNPVTTLVSLVLDARPDLKLDGAEARVRSFLKFPVNYPLGLALRQGTHYTCPFFSAAAFITEAQAAGGLDAFVHLLLQELASDSTHSFRPPTLLGSTTSTATTVVETGMEAAVLDYAGANNAANLTGWAMSLTGLTGGSSDDISALMDELLELQSEIEDLQYQVAQLTLLVQATATQTQYNTIVVPAQTLANQVNGVENNLAYFANACPPLPAGSTPTPPDSYCTNDKASINFELNDVTIQQAYVTLEGYVGDNSAIGFKGMLHLYSLWLFETRPAFWRAADSTKMQNLYNYWDGALTQAANLFVELQHELGAQTNPGGQKQLTDFLGNPDLNPPTTGTFQANQAANLTLRRQPVPAGVVISTVDGTMWSLVPWQPVPNQTPPPGYYAIMQPAAGCWAVPYSQLLKLDTSNAFSTYYGLSYWLDLPPFKSAWQAAVKNAPPGTDWQQWLIDQTKTDPTQNETPASNGFFNGNSCPHASWVDNEDEPSTWQWAIFPNGQSTFIKAGTGDSNLLWPWRTQKTGEFYFWTN